MLSGQRKYIIKETAKRTEDSSPEWDGGRREGRRRGGQNSSSGAGSKMATGKEGDRWSLSAAELEKWGKGTDLRM